MFARPFRLLLAAVLTVGGPWAAMAQRGAQAPIQGAGSVSSGDYSAPSALPMPMMARSVVVDPNRKLQPGDTLSFRILEDRAPVATQLAVTHSGDLLVEPLPRAVHVAGMTAQQAGAEIKQQLERDYYYSATVQLTLETASAAGIGYVYFTGAVNRVGAFPISADRPMKLSEAIITGAAGFSRFADKRRVRVTRAAPGGASEVKTMDMKAVIEEGKLDRDMEVKDGDSIFVPENYIKLN